MSPAPPPNVDLICFIYHLKFYWCWCTCWVQITIQLTMKLTMIWLNWWCLCHCESFHSTTIELQFFLLENNYSYYTSSDAVLFLLCSISFLFLLPSWLCFCLVTCLGFTCFVVVSRCSQVVTSKIPLLDWITGNQLFVWKLSIWFGFFWCFIQMLLCSS